MKCVPYEYAIILRIPLAVDKLLKMSMINWDNPRICLAKQTNISVKNLKLAHQIVFKLQVKNHSTM